MTLQRATHKDYQFGDWYKGFETNPVQRDTVKRAQRQDIKDRFKTFNEEHFEVAGTTLVNDDVDEVSGKFYPAGTQFKVDGHTRPQVVNNGDSDITPKDIDEAGGFSATLTESQSIQEVKDRYKRHDSAEAVEKRSDAVASAFRCAYANKDCPIPDNPMFMFSQPLSYAAHYTFGPSIFPKDSGLDQDLLSKAVKAFIPAFDQLENTTFIIKQKKSNLGQIQENIVFDRWLSFATFSTGFFYNFNSAWYAAVMKINNCDLDGLAKRKGEGSTAVSLIANEWCQQRTPHFDDKRLNKGNLKSQLIDQLFFLFDTAIRTPDKRIKEVNKCKNFWKNNYKYHAGNNALSKAFIIVPE
jgi:hypothetical protein